MGDIDDASPRPDRPADDSDHVTGTFHASLEGAPEPPAPADCPFCDLPQDRYATDRAGHWILLEPRILVPAHTVPPRRRWIITSTGTALNLWDAEPLPGALCRIPHRMACPRLDPEDHWPRVTALRRFNDRRSQRLFDLPEDGPPGTGWPRDDDAVKRRRGAPGHGRRWMKSTTWETVPDGGRRVCAACGTAVRSYRYRFHPPESPMFERCIGLAWCNGCGVYSGSMVYVPRDQVLVDALAQLPPDERERLGRSETRLIGYLDERAGDETWPSGP
ncbi:DUF6083 domain-containing protein [Streptomyces sp. NPDC014623]|uniref:DUF6083 domain-containing protein n=1 Tax=Streptomyces sp. NPDC014623 TaxID=3364875 RepID=UPI0036F87885